MVKKDPCLRYACEIQKCLQGNDYNEDRCVVAIQRLSDCCKRFNYTPLCCEGIPQEDTPQKNPDKDSNSHGKKK